MVTVWCDDIEDVSTAHEDDTGWIVCDTCESTEHAEFPEIP